MFSFAVRRRTDVHNEATPILRQGRGTAMKGRLMSHFSVLGTGGGRVGILIILFRNHFELIRENPAHRRIILSI